MTYLFIYLFIWITNGLIVLKVMKCLTKVTVNLYLSIQLIIYFSEEDNSICMFKWGRECISLFTFLSWSTAKVGIKKCHENGKEKKIFWLFLACVVTLLSVCFSVTSGIFFPVTLKVHYRTLASLSPSLVEVQVILQKKSFIPTFIVLQV